ncbi:MAG: sugar transferase [Crocinitomicaceae bacterium]|nr:sugar transferase [Crocinitomicaceae bacterium]
MKRLFDMMGALVLLLCVLPVIAFAAMTILIFDQQNPLFTQTRLGKFKKTFRILKLRTMKNNQVTHLGGVLRRTGIDELPQLFHVIAGKMSFVGPRPLTQADVERLNWNDTYHQTRWSVAPGLTGLAQLSPVCNKKMSWFLDMKYCLCRSFSLDLKIIMASAIIPFIGKQKTIRWFHTKRA